MVLKRLLYSLRINRCVNKKEVLDICKIRELNNNILEKDFSFNNHKVDQGISDGNISNL